MRHHRIDCGDGSMRSGPVLGRIIHCLFNLSLWILFIVLSIYELLKLSCGIVSILDWFHCLCGMSRRIVLRVSGSLSSDGKLLLRIIFQCVRDGVLKLSCRVIPS